MSKFNKTTTKNTNIVVNHENNEQFGLDPRTELYTLCATTLIKKTFYESEEEIVSRLQSLIAQICKNEEGILWCAKLAIYTRHKMAMRSSSHILAYELAKYLSGKAYSKTFYHKIVRIPQDITEILSLTLSKGKLPKAMTKGFKLALEGFNLYQLRKYHQTSSQVSMIDAIRLCRPKSEAISSFIEMLNTNGTKGLSTSKEAKQSRVATSSEGNKEAITENLVKELDVTGYMAIIRSLRTFKNTTNENIDLLCQKIVDQNLILKSKVFPFQILTALIVAREDHLDQKIVSALNKAIELSLPNVPILNGNTLIVQDVSGSMTNSSDSRLNEAQKSSIFSACLFKTNPDAALIAVDQAVYEVDSMKEDTITSISKELMKRSGGGTYLEYAFKYAIEKGKRYDRVIFLTDSETFSTTSDYYKDYKKSFNPNLKTYTIQFSGTNSTMFNTKDPNNFIFAGYNDQVFKTIASELSPDKIIKLINEVSLEGQLI